MSIDVAEIKRKFRVAVGAGEIPHLSKISNRIIVCYGIEYMAIPYIKRGIFPTSPCAFCDLYERRCQKPFGVNCSKDKRGDKEDVFWKRREDALEAIEDIRSNDKAKYRYSFEIYAGCKLLARLQQEQQDLLSVLKKRVKQIGAIGD
jgi:hypothetical protein